MTAPSVAVQQAAAVAPHALAEAPVEMPASHDEAMATDSGPPPPRWLDPVAMLTLFPLGAALASVSVPRLCVAVIPLAVVAVLVGLISVARALVLGNVRLVSSLSSSLFGLVVFIAALFFPALLGPTYQASRLKDPGDPRAIRAIPLRAGVSSEDTEWVDASRAALQQGNLRLRIVDVWIGPAEPVDAAKKKAPSDERLFVKVRAYHVDDPGVNVNHPPPYRDEDQHPRLTDSAGKSYPERPVRDHKDSVGASSKFPIKVVDEVLVFDPPSSGAEYLHLELPAAGWGRSGNFRFTIPHAMIERRSGGNAAGTGRRSGN